MKSKLVCKLLFKLKEIGFDLKVFPIKYGNFGLPTSSIVAW